MDCAHYHADTNSGESQRRLRPRSLIMGLDICPILESGQQSRKDLQIMSNEKQNKNEVRQESHGNQSPNVVGDDAKIKYDNRKIDKRKIDKRKFFNISGSAFGMIAISAVAVIAIGVQQFNYWSERKDNEALVKSLSAEIPNSGLLPENWEAMREYYEDELLVQMTAGIRGVKNDIKKQLDRGEFDDALKAARTASRAAADAAVGDDDWLSNSDKAALAFVQGGIFFLKSQYKNALKQYENALVYIESDDTGLNDKDRNDLKIHYQNAIGMLELTRDELDAAKIAFQLALDTNPEDPANIAIGNNNLGKVWYKITNTDQAIVHFKEAKAAVKKGSILDADITNNLAAAYEYDLECDLAQDLYKQAANIYEKIGLKQNRRYANTLSNQGISLIQCDEAYEEGIQKLNDALKIRTDALVEKEDPSVAYQYYNLGVAYSIVGKYDDAKNSFEISERIFDDTLQDPDHRASEMVSERLTEVNARLTELNN